MTPIINKVEFVLDISGHEAVIGQSFLRVHPHYQVYELEVKKSLV